MTKPDRPRLRWTTQDEARMDADIERIQAMSDDQILADAAARGVDVHAEAERCRTIFRRVKDKIDGI